MESEKVYFPFAKSNFLLRFTIFPRIKMKISAFSINREISTLFLSLAETNRIRIINLITLREFPSNSKKLIFLNYSQRDFSFFYGGHRHTVGFGDQVFSSIDVSTFLHNRRDSVWHFTQNKFSRKHKFSTDAS